VLSSKFKDRTTWSNPELRTQHPSLRGRAGPGDPAAHRTDRLPLLPSGPGGVHRVLSHRAQPLLQSSKCWVLS